VSEVRYPNSLNPIVTDGRDIDTRIGALLGEGSLQRVEPVDRRFKHDARVSRELRQSDPSDPTYYNRPMLKAPVWEPYIPAYYFLGGAAGASLALGAAVQLDRSKATSGLVRKAHWVGIVASSIGAVCLILDLGRPTRFLNMMRVFRPTSPMNMGAWILAGTPPAAIAAGLFARSSLFCGLGEVCGYISGFLGLGLCTYTGVLVGNTAIPVYQEGRRVLPILFGASAASAAGGVLGMFGDLNARERRIVRGFTALGAAAEFACSKWMEHETSHVEQVGLPLKRGLSGALWKSAGFLSFAALAVTIAPGSGRTKRVIGGSLAALGSFALRFAVHYAGEASARDPKASFHLQRNRG
jgi:formate-dependent nitrite reductase membrane component NrfD